MIASHDAERLFAAVDGLPGEALETFVWLVRAELKARVPDVFAALGPDDGLFRPLMRADFDALSAHPRAGEALAIWVAVARNNFEGRGAAARAVEEFERVTFGVGPRGLGVVSIPQRVIVADDLVPFGWLQAGAASGLAVGWVGLDKIVNGQKVPGIVESGTCFLVDSTHVLTCHHVIAARNAYEAAPSAEDLRLQVESARVSFDFVEDGTQTSLRVARLIAADPELDYALLELATAATPTPVRLYVGELPAIEGTGYCVNIIQHPLGDPKALAMRNNAVVRHDVRDVLYFTATKVGSSGAPVFDDRWRVVAIHRAYERHDVQEYQGRKFAFVNAGTRITKVLDDLDEKLAGTTAAFIRER